MTEIGRGIDVYYENEKYIVFFADGSIKHYNTGGLLFEVFSDESFYMITEKVGNMIKCSPDYQAAISAESITAGFQWLYGTIEDDEFPVSTELFRSYFNEVIYDVQEQTPSCDSFSCVGAFLLECYRVYMEHMKDFALFVDSLATDESDVADNFGKDCAGAFRDVAEDLYEEYRRICSVRKKNSKVSVTVHRFTNPMQLLIFEYCRLKKNNKVLKQCVNCGRLFIPKGRNDAIYCVAASPQNPDKPCSEIGPQIARTKRRRSDSLESEHNRIYSRLVMASKRARDVGESHLIPDYQKRLNKEMNRYYAAKDATNNNDKE